MKDIGVYRPAGKIDREIISAVEKKLGYLLPESYKELISSNDFLRPKLDLFRFGEEGKRMKGM